MPTASHASPTHISTRACTASIWTSTTPPDHCRGLYPVGLANANARPITWQLSRCRHSTPGPSRLPTTPGAKRRLVVSWPLRLLGQLRLLRISLATARCGGSCAGRTGIGQIVALWVGKELDSYADSYQGGVRGH